MNADQNNSNIVDASFVSFVNSTHHINDEGPEFEILFQNQALTKILNLHPDDLVNFLEMPIFLNTELQSPMSLESAAKNRYSDAVLSQVYKVSLPKKRKMERTGADRYAVELQDRLISFNRFEIIFDGRKSVMINIRDISDIQNFNKMLKANDTLRNAYKCLQEELKRPFSSIDSA